MHTSDLSENFEDGSSDSVCNYYSIQECCDLLKGEHDNLDLFLVNYNIRSFHANTDSFSTLLSSFQMQPNFIILTETWNTHNTINMCSLENYYGFHTYREGPNARGGGVSIFSRDNLSCSKITELSLCNENIESCAIKINFGGKFILILALYRPPRGSKELFISSLETLLNHATVRHSDSTIIGGDMNLNLLDVNCPLVNQYKNLLQSYRTLPVISKPTRFSSNASTAPTLLDHICFNSLANYRAGILDFDLTDHCPTFMIFSSPVVVNRNLNQTNVIRFRLHTEQFFAKFAENLEATNWDYIISTDDVDQKFEFFTSKLDELYCSSFPIKTKRISRKRMNKPWLNQRILRLIKEKSDYFKLFRMGIISSRVNNSFKNSVNKTIQSAKNSYFKNAFDQINSDVRKSWELINRLIGKHSTKSEIKQLIINGNSFSNDFDIAENFNNFFKNIAQEINNLLPQSNSTARYFLPPTPNINSFNLRPISLQECEKLISSLKNTKSGLNSIPVKILKQFKSEISKPLSLLINLSLSKSVFPNVLKIARVTPIFKKGNDTDPSNYRPISCLPIFSKLLEKFVVNQLRTFSEKNSLIDKSQLGFQRGISTCDALVRLTEILYNGLDKKMHNINVLIDLTKAFDTVNIETLLMKLEFYGIRGASLAWLKSFMTNRRQYVAIRGTNSSTVSLGNHGLPQGSTLSPALFLFYINDLPKVLPDSQVTLFADDTTITLANNDSRTLNLETNENLEQVYDWCLANRLTINVNKTEMLLVTNRDPGCLDNRSILLGNRYLDFSSTCKFLGVTLDNRLSFSNHTSNISNKVSIYVGVLYKLRHQFNLKAKLNFYYGMIYPILNYCIIVWGGTYSTHLANLSKLQKRAVRLILGAPFDSHSTPIFYTLKILKLSEIYKFNLCVYMYKQIRAGNFNVQHEINTRNRNLAAPQYHRLSTTQHSVSFNGPKIYNSLPNHLKNNNSLPRFKKELKLHFLNSYASENS